LKKPDKKITVERAKHLLEKEDATPSMYISDIAKLFDVTVSNATEGSPVGRGMSRGYRRIIFSLAHEDGVTQLSLVKHTHLTAPSVSAALSKMEQEGLVERRADEKDLRQVRVFLTEKGRAHDNLIRETSHQTEEKMLSCLTEEEIDSLTVILRKILENMVGKEDE
jgi:DNA-binding MarR family transcriptional regulator